MNEERRPTRLDQLILETGKVPQDVVVTIGGSRWVIKWGTGSHVFSFDLYQGQDELVGEGILYFGGELKLLLFDESVLPAGTPEEEALIQEIMGLGPKMSAWAFGDGREFDRDD